MLKIASGVLLVICIVAIVFALLAVFKLLAVILLTLFVAWLCWSVIKPLFTPAGETEDEERRR